MTLFDPIHFNTNTFNYFLAKFPDLTQTTHFDRYTQFDLVWLKHIQKLDKHQLPSNTII